MISSRTILIAFVLVHAGAFSPSDHIVAKSVDIQSRTSSTVLFSEPKKKGGLETGLRSKLVSESIAPWRTLRLFAYGALGSGAFIGGLINTSGAVAGSSSPDFNLNTEVSSTNTEHKTRRFLD